MFVRRGSKAYLRTAPGGPEPITGAPEGGAVPTAPAPVAPPAVAAAFDPESPAVKAYLDKVLAKERARIAAEEGGRARDTARAGARNDALSEIATALGLKPAEVDPAKVAADLTQAQAEARSLKIDRAIDRAARAAGADEDLVGAVLMRAGKLAGLDPSADDFATKTKALVDEAVAANPRLKLETTPAPAAQGAVNNGFNAPPAAGQRLGLIGAVAKQLGAQRPPT